MEKPFYGRTGLLETSRAGAPVEKLRLLTRDGTSSPAPLKWSPTLLTVPQLLLTHIATTGDAVDDAGFSTFLCLAAVAEAVCRAWPGCTGAMPIAHARRRAVAHSVLSWAAEKRASSTPLRVEPECTEWYLPSLKLLTMKEEAVLAQLPAVSARAVTLFGKDHAINDIPLDHPSCSAQHAALQVQFVFSEMESMVEKIASEVPSGRHGSQLAAQWIAAAGANSVTSPSSPRSLGVPSGDDAHTLYRSLWDEVIVKEVNADDFASLWTLELQIMDLGSTNGSFLNGERLESFVPSNVIDGDVITFGASTRQYVLLRSR